jgi:DNA-binding NarL/FixJ family response regulator
VVVLGQVGSVAEYPSPFATGLADVLVIDAGDTDNLDYEALTNLHRQRPDLAIAIVAMRHRRGMLDRLYRAGVRAFVTEDVGLPALLNMLYTVKARPRVFLVRIGG